MNSKSFLGKLALILVVLGAIFFMVRHFWVDSRIKEMQEQINQTLAQVDSLQKENVLLLNQVVGIDSLLAEKQEKISILTTNLSATKRKLDEIRENRYVFEGTNDSLLRDLNRAFRIGLRDSTNQ